LTRNRLAARDHWRVALSGWVGRRAESTRAARARPAPDAFSITGARPMNLLKTLLVAALALTATSIHAADRYAVYESDSSFSDVMDGLKLAIQQRGMFINNMMHMNEMLERTGEDLGLGGPLFGQAESIEFCSAVLSRKMISEDPRRIVNCPFIIAVYTLPDAPGTTYVAHRVIPDSETEDSEAMAEVAAMLEDVAEEAVSW
jgi:uncharacterized protein (DUF302 family)